MVDVTLRVNLQEYDTIQAALDYVDRFVVSAPGCLPDSYVKIASKHGEMPLESLQTLRKKLAEQHDHPQEQVAGARA